MSIRELCVSELSQVSGGFSSLEEAHAAGQALSSAKSIAEAYAKYDPRYSGMHWKLVAATDPGLRESYIALLDSVGLGGKETMDAWMAKYS